MRPHHGALVALLLLLCIHGGREAEAAGGGFVRAQGTRFVVNGSPYYANGFNAYWLMTMAADPAQKGKVTSALSQAAGRGLSVARTWAFSDGGSNALQYSPGKYNENTFKGLDFVLSEARKYGVKVILSLVNNYDTFGGKKQYVDWARGQGQAIGSDDEFFTNSLVKGFYKNHIKAHLGMSTTGKEAAAKVELPKRSCVPCNSKDLHAMTEDSAKKLLEQVTGWELKTEGEILKLHRAWKVKNFVKGLEFFQLVAAIAEEEGHHPDLHLVGWNNVNIDVWTHSVRGLTDNDFILAAKINELKLESLLSKKKAITHE